MKERVGVSASSEACIEEIQTRLSEKIPEKAFFSHYKPDSQWFLRDPHGVHGMTHQARVLVLQEILASLEVETYEIPLNREALRWSASTHDLRRIDDGRDPEHGLRSADWVSQHLAELPSPTLETVMYVNTWHVPPDTAAPVMTPELAIFKDADALDRPRLEELFPGVLTFVDERKLRHASSRELLMPPAKSFYEKSRKYPSEEGFEYILYTAERMGLIR